MLRKFLKQKENNTDENIRLIKKKIWFKHGKYVGTGTTQHLFNSYIKSHIKINSK